MKIAYRTENCDDAFLMFHVSHSVFAVKKENCDKLNKTQTLWKNPHSRKVVK